MALRAAGARSDQVAAAASFDGGDGAYTGALDSPLTLLSRAKVHLYFGHSA